MSERSEYRPGTSMYDTILVGTDGSESANNAVEYAMILADKFGSELHAVTVVNTRRYGEPALSSMELVINELEDRGTQQLQEIGEQCEQRNIDVITQCFHGEPSEELVRYADEQEVDIIVLGYQGRTHTGDRMGSTANRVVNGTDRAVLLV